MALSVWNTLEWVVTPVWHMRRRTILAGCVTAVLAGCLEGDTDERLTSPSTNDTTPESAGTVEYDIALEPPVDEPGGVDVCAFEDLPAAVKDELEVPLEAIEDEPVLHSVSEEPALLETDCSGGVLAHEGQYYPVSVVVGSG